MGPTRPDSSPLPTPSCTVGREFEFALPDKEEALSGFPNLAGFLLPCVPAKGEAGMAEISADGDGCIRRRCVDCGRHFASNIEQQDRYWCPYCGVQNSWECWFTPAQQKYLDEALADDVLSSAYQELDGVLTGRALDSDGVIEMRPALDQALHSEPLRESTADLAPVSVSCHPAARLKLEPGWSAVVWCHFCAAPTESTRTTLGRVRLQRRES